MLGSGWACVTAVGGEAQACAGVAATGGMGRPNRAISNVEVTCEPYWIVSEPSGPPILISLTVKETPASIHDCGIWKTAWRMNEPGKGWPLMTSLTCSNPRTICQQSAAVAPAGSFGSSGKSYMAKLGIWM